MPHSSVALSLAVVFLLSAHCRAEDGIATRVDALVRGEMLTQHIPGVSLLVNKDGKIALVKGYGLANVEEHVAVKPDTVFQSGSVGKQFTATAVMMLVEEGKLGLDDKLNKYLTNVPQSWANIKVRHLLTHTSGLGDYLSDFDVQQDYTQDELLAKVAATPLAFQPGEKWSYSNLGYLTLGILIGKVTGTFYGDFLQERIFKPLGMTTARIISEADIVTNRAAGYRLVKGELKNQEWVSPTMNSTADGSLYLTVYDLAKWDAALYTEKLLKRSSLNQMWTPVTLNNDKTHPYGFGWFVVDVRGHRLIHHAGSWQGFQCDIQRYVGNKLTVIGFDNLAGSNLEKIVRGVAALYNPELKPMPPKER
ncbi:MAG TPA: serine hydrolase domain-containing protein [Candidatus Binatia bacterium]|jgi:CubicO group peptidase (beta-lactamase class C family)|nr:serine hydrolase domain-containing protein [Candidatus Binatia bacterium]